MTASSRWAGFTDSELVALIDAITLDDGIRHSVEVTDEPTYTLLGEIALEAARRDLCTVEPLAGSIWVEPRRKTRSRAAILGELRELGVTVDWPALRENSR